MRHRVVSPFGVSDRESGAIILSTKSRGKSSIAHRAMQRSDHRNALDRHSTANLNSRQSGAPPRNRWRYPCSVIHFARARWVSKARFARRRLTNWIDVQHDLRHFAPIGAFGVGVEQPQIGNKVLLVVGRQRGVGRRDIGDIWIEWRLLHRGSTHRRALLSKEHGPSRRIFRQSLASFHIAAPGMCRHTYYRR